MSVPKFDQSYLTKLIHGEVKKQFNHHKKLNLKNSKELILNRQTSCRELITSIDIDSHHDFTYNQIFNNYTVRFS